jgi:hypothetical protein
VILPREYFHRAYLIEVGELVAKGGLSLSTREFYQITHCFRDPKILGLASSAELVESIL